MNHLTPPATATPFNEPAQVTLSQNQRGTLTFTPSQSGAAFHLPVLAITKHTNATYEARTDGNLAYGPAPVPPTDLDDLATTFMPPRTFDQELVVVIVNTDAATRTFTVQPIGWEVA